VIGIVLCLLGFVSTWYAAKGSLGRGLGVCFAWGYVYGVLRANFLDGFTHFLFDSAVLGIYCAKLRFDPHHNAHHIIRSLYQKIKYLCLWPAFLLVIPYDNLLINLVGLRVAVFYVPFLLVCVQCTDRNLDEIATWLSVLNIFALGAAVMEVRNGIEYFYPRNAVTELIYASAIGEESSHRIPAIFCTAAHYGACMSLSMALIIRSLFYEQKILTNIIYSCGIGAAGAGLLLCSCRSPVLGAIFGLIVFVVAQPQLLVKGKMIFIAIPLLIGIVYTFREGGDRAARFLELNDTEMMSERVSHIDDFSIFEAMITYPMGNGLAGAAGITIPYFLQSLAVPREIPGAESEYFRILFTQGIPGLFMWIGFLIWFFVATIIRVDSRRPVAHYLLYGTLLGSFTLASRGVGLLNGLPNNCLLFLAMATCLREVVKADTRSRLV
jgi:hypothetical protein